MKLWTCEPSLTGHPCWLFHGEFIVDVNTFLRQRSTFSDLISTSRMELNFHQYYILIINEDYENCHPLNPRSTTKLKILDEFKVRKTSGGAFKALSNIYDGTFFLRIYLTAFSYCVFKMF